jgi:hypothetical protein
MAADAGMAAAAIADCPSAAEATAAAATADAPSAAAATADAPSAAAATAVHCRQVDLVSRSRELLRGSNRVGSVLPPSLVCFGGALLW